MKYLGGKFRLAPKLRACMEADLARHGYRVWEPFCGGLNFSRKLTDCQGLLSDVHPALIGMYKAFRSGWRPPHSISRSQYERAKALPDSDPLKAFVGFGCSFGGKYFAGYDPPVDRPIRQRDGSVLNGRARPAFAAAESLKVLNALRGFSIARLDFLAARARPIAALIYCDPPYANTTGYGGDAFDSDVFWESALQWARHTTVLVSEYACPVPSVIRFECAHVRAMSAVASTATTAPVERLFQILPP